MTDTQFVDVTWGDEAQTYLRWNFHGDWSGRDYFDSLVNLWRLMDSKSHNLNLLIDMRLSGKSPSNLVALMQAAIRNKQQSCNIRQIVVISQTSYWKTVYEIACRHKTAIAQLDVRFATSNVEANTILNQSEI